MRTYHLWEWISMILKRCSKPGCVEYISRSQQPPYCIKHIRERNKVYDKSRDPRTVQFYGSSVWKKLRASVLAESHYLCEPCKAKGKLTTADTVHHCVELKDNWELRLTRSNLLAICRTCHEEIHDRFS